MAEPIKISPLKTQTVELTIEGISPLIQHRWSAKAKLQMELKKQGKASEARELSRQPSDKEQEFEEATYRLPDGRFAMPVTAIKCAMIEATHKDLGVPKTTLRKAVFLEHEAITPDGPMVELHAEERLMRTDPVRVQTSTDLRYRPEFHGWHINLRMSVDTALLTVQSAVNLLERAGYGVGIGEWRPEKDGGGEFGRFVVKRG